MELPEFNVSGTGPQGTGGIPPEGMQEALRARGVDLIGANLNPEDSPAAEAVLNRESEALAGQMGLTQQPPAQPDTAIQQPPAQAAPTPETSAGQQPPQVGVTDADLQTRLRAITEKYRGDFPSLAQAHVHAQAGMTRAQQEAAAIRGAAPDMALLNQKVDTLTNTVTSLLTQRPQEPQYQQPQYQPQPQTQPGVPAGTSSFDEFVANPAAVIARVVQPVIQENLVAYAQAQRQQESLRRAEEFKAQNQADIARLEPIMQDIYVRNQVYYGNMTKDEAMKDLLERARDKEAALGGRALYDWVSSGGVNPAAGGQPMANPGAAGLPSGNSAPTRQQGPAAPNGNWAGTNNFKKLWNTRDGSMDETRVVMDVLRERGFGE